MAGGWAKDGAVSEQIEASISDELARMRARKAPVGDSLTHCAECEEPIPEARRKAVPGVKLCWLCHARSSVSCTRSSAWVGEPVSPTDASAAKLELLVRTLRGQNR